MGGGTYPIRALKIHYRKLMLSSDVMPPFNVRDPDFEHDGDEPEDDDDEEEEEEAAAED